MPAERAQARPPLPRLLWAPDPEGGEAMRTQALRVAAADHEAPIALWLRAPAWTSLALHAWALELVQARSASVSILLSRRADVAIAAGADGVHLPARGLNVEDARALLGPSALIGVSCHDEAELALARGADYATLSPVRDVPGKGPALGLARFAELLRGAPLPVLALGGIDVDTAREVIRLGAHGVALRRAIDHASDPLAAVGRFLHAIRTAPLP